MFARLLLCLLIIPAALALAPLNPGDLNGDGVVDAQDILIISLELDRQPLSDPRADPTGDGIADVYDCVAVAQHWGRTYTSPPSPPPPATQYHEPSGMTQVTDRPFTSLAAANGDIAGSQGWDSVEYKYANFALIQDAGAPLSPDSVLRITYPAGFNGGSAPGTAQKAITGPTVHTVYTRFSMKLADDFFGHGSNTNKILHFWVDGSNRVFLSAEGKNMSTLQFQVRLQGSPSTETRPRLPPNTGANGTVPRGQWVTWELLLIANTPGQNDGVAQVWKDGVLTHNYSDVGMSTNGKWEQVQLSPTWGGTGQTTPYSFTMDIDHVYVSAK